MAYINSDDDEYQNAIEIEEDDNQEQKQQQPLNPVIQKIQIQLPPPKKLDTRLPEYLIYKKSILGSDYPNYHDKFANYYYITHPRVLKNFVSNIKSLAINNKLDTKHYEDIAKAIISDKLIHFVAPIVLIEYNDYKSIDKQNLIEVLDGHHRIKAISKTIEQLAENLEGIEIYLNIKVVSGDKPSSQKTKELFWKYNNTKPFKVNYNFMHIATILVEKINKEYKKEHFTLIRDSAQRVNRPSISKTAFCELVSEQLKLQADLSEKTIQEQDVDGLVSKMMKKVLNLNENLNIYSIKDFNDKTKPYYCGGVITDKQYDKSQKYQCFLGIISLSYLIQQCITF